MVLPVILPVGYFCTNTTHKTSFFYLDILRCQELPGFLTCDYSLCSSIHCLLAQCSYIWSLPKQEVCKRSWLRHRVLSITKVLLLSILCTGYLIHSFVSLSANNCLSQLLTNPSFSTISFCVPPFQWFLTFFEMWTTRRR